MYCWENLQPFIPPLMNFNPNCAVQNRVPNRNPGLSSTGLLYRSLANNHTKSSYLPPSSGFKQVRPCSKTEEIFCVANSKVELSSIKTCEKFNELNHPLMSIDCRKNMEIKSVSPTHGAITSQSTTPGHYQKFKQLCKTSFRSSGHTVNEHPRGTKRHYHNNRTSRSPSPLPCNSSTTLPGDSVASKPKRRYQEGCEFFPPIIPSACLLEINILSHHPDNLLNGGEWDRLSHALWCKFTSHEQTPETLKRKLRLRHIVYSYIRNYMPPQCELYIVGSSVSGFGDDSSDMDLCLVIATYDIDQRFHALEYLYTVQKVLKQLCRNTLTKLDVIRAKVPILRFSDNCSNLEVDLNCNNLVGIRNTHLLRTYAQIDWRVRPLVLAVKLWARKHGINDAKTMTISSYSLTLMVIHYLQCGVSPPILCCLQKMRADRFYPEGDIRRIMPFSDDELKPLRSNNDATLGQLFAGFLEYYASKFNYNLHAISIRVGGTLVIDQCRQYVSPKNDPYHWRFLCIEEPFDRTNTARSVFQLEAFHRIIQVFCDSSAKINETKDLACVLE